MALCGCRLVPGRNVPVRNEPVSAARDGLDVARSKPVVPKSTSKLIDGRSQHVIRYLDVAPDLRDQILFPHRLAAPGVQSRQNLRRFRLDADHLIPSDQTVPIDLYRPFAEPESSHPQRDGRVGRTAAGAHQPGAARAPHESVPTPGGGGARAVRRQSRSSCSWPGRTSGAGKPLRVMAEQRFRITALLRSKSICSTQIIQPEERENSYVHVTPVGPSPPPSRPSRACVLPSSLFRRSCVLPSGPSAV